jgi:hypothetical protein
MYGLKVVPKKQYLSYFKCLWLLLLANVVYADPTLLRMGIHNFPPDFVVSADGKVCGGPGLEQTRRIFAGQQVKIEAVCVAPARMYLLLDSGAVDFSINIKSTKAIAAQHEFINPAYSQLQLVMYSHKAASTAPRDNSVALIRGFDYQGQRAALNQRGFVMVDLPDSVSASELFLHQRSQHLLTYDGPFRAYVQAKNAALLSQFDRRALSSIDTFYVLSGSSPHGKLMRDTIISYAQRHQCNYLKSCQP